MSPEQSETPTRGWADLTGIDAATVRQLDEAENARFVAERPRPMASGCSKSSSPR